MIRTPVASSNIASIGYDAETRMLEIAFKSGGVYQYAGVPVSAYSALMAAPSHGKHFEANIKRDFAFKKVN